MMGMLPNFCHTLFGFDIYSLESEIIDRECDINLPDGPSIKFIAFRQLYDSFESALSRWENFARKRRHDEFENEMLTELASFMLLSNRYSTFSFYEMDDNDQTNDKILHEFFKGIESTPKPSRHASIPEKLLTTMGKIFPPRIVNVVEKVPDSLIYAIAAMKKAALGLAYLKAASSLQLSLIAPLSERESIEFALLQCGDARVLIMRMRMAEVLERYSDSKNLPENAVISINDELGIMKKKTNAAIQTKKKKIIAATARRDINGGNKWRVIAALKSGEIQKNIAINLGIGDSRVSQIKKQYKKEREIIEKINSGKSKEAIAVEFGISAEKVSEIIEDHRKNDR